jgi:hypothetical protein
MHLNDIVLGTLGVGERLSRTSPEAPAWDGIIMWGSIAVSSFTYNLIIPTVLGG